MGITSFTLLGVNKECLGRLAILACPPSTVESDYHDPTMSVKPGGSRTGRHAIQPVAPRRRLRLRRRNHQRLTDQDPVAIGQVVGPQDRRFRHPEALGD